jgi:hypothetical protein
MTTSKPPVTHKPFKNLKALLDEKSFPLANGQKEKPARKMVKHKVADTDGEDGLFQKAMTGVEPIVRDLPPTDIGDAFPARVSAQDPDAEALARLEDLVRGGNGDME